MSAVKMMSARRSAIAGAASLSFLLLGCGTREKPGTEAASDRVEVGVPMPAYATMSLDGDSVSLAGQRGKVVLLNVWATWCHPCRTEIPELVTVHARYDPDSDYDTAGFYSRFGFTFADGEGRRVEGQPFRAMYFDLKPILDALAAE